MLLILLLLVPIIGIFIIVTLPCENKSILNYNIMSVFALHVAGLCIALPLRAILYMVSPCIDSAFFIIISVGLISYLCIAMKNLSSHGKFPSKYMAIWTFVFSCISGILTLGVDYTSIIYVIHHWVLYSLSLLGLEISLFNPMFEPIRGLINLFSIESSDNSSSSSSSSNPSNITNNNGNSSTSGSSSDTLNSSENNPSATMRSRFRSNLETISSTINSQIRNLQISNINFEKYLKKANSFRSIGAEVEANYYAQLARRERLNIQNNLTLLQTHINYRSNLVLQAQVLFPSHRFEVYNGVSTSNTSIRNISYTLATNPRWNV